MKRIKFLCGIFLLMILAGVITGSIFLDSYYSALKDVTDDFLDNIINHAMYMGDKEKLALFGKLVIDRSGPYILMWVLAESKYGLYYLLWFICSRGFKIGFVCNFIARAYKEEALTIIPAYYFPQYLLYAVVFGLVIIYVIFRTVKHRKTLFVALWFLLTAGCFLEAYINPEIFTLLL